MNPDFWSERWREGRIGFHEGKPNAFLEKHLSVLGERRRVLVPLCGKAEDLAYLAKHGHNVVGVELVRDAVVAFFAEHQLNPHVSPHGAFEKFEAGRMTILVGDFFALTHESAGPVNALYDRAAIIALPPELRGRYVEHLRTLLPADAPGLVITLEYPQEQQPGPPFSVPEAELREHYKGLELSALEAKPWESRNGPVTGQELSFRVKF